LVTLPVGTSHDRYRSKYRPALEEKRELPQDPAEPAARQCRGSIPLSFNQQSLWFVHQLAPRSPAYNFLFAARLGGRLDIPALVRAFGGWSSASGAAHALRRSRQQTRADCRRQPGPGDPDHRSFIVVPGGDQDFLYPAGRRTVRPGTWTGAAVEVLRISASATVLLLVFHHIMQTYGPWTFAARLGEAYQAEVSGNVWTLAPLQAQFTDYVRWQLGAVLGPGGQQAWNYWRRQLAGELPVLNLPTDRPRPPVRPTMAPATPGPWTWSTSRDCERWPRTGRDLVHGPVGGFSNFALSLHRAGGFPGWDRHR